MSDPLDDAEKSLLEDASKPLENSTSEAYPRKDGKYREIARIIGCCVSCASAGWHDGCLGALIPYLQRYYGGLSDEKISLLWLISFIGFTPASLLNVTLSTRLGLGRLLMLGAAIQGIASAVIACQPPFSGLLICYVFAGFGMATQDAQFNTYIARLPGSATKLGILHAFYGLGALASPVAATLAMKADVPPPMFYLYNLAWCIVSIGVLIMGFGLGDGRSSEIKLQCEGQEIRKVAPLRAVVSSRIVLTALIFITLYSGSETTEAGWVVSFLMRERGGGGRAGYASAAFYGGLTSSRILLLPLTAYLRENKAVALYVTVALSTQLVIWLSPSFIANLVAVGACGFVMGPVYPVTVALVTKATPHSYHPGALSLMACVGQSGSALFPFLVGSMASVYGIEVLQHVLVSLFAVMFVIWKLVPAPRITSLGYEDGDSKFTGDFDVA
ncbi:MFS transporter [Diplocarpon mali]|nr:MFS transporter [Diplocarpon mali]